MMTIDQKELYERMDVVLAALPDTAREDFAELVSQLATSHPADAVFTVARWRRDHGFPKYT